MREEDRKRQKQQMSGERDAEEERAKMLHDKLAKLDALPRKARVQRRDVRSVVREVMRRERAARAVGQRDEERGEAGRLGRGASARLVQPAHDGADDDGANRRQRRARRAVVRPRQCREARGVGERQLEPRAPPLSEGHTLDGALDQVTDTKVGSDGGGGSALRHREVMPKHCVRAKDV